jgi:hypothetical protein
VEMTRKGAAKNHVYPSGLHYDGSVVGPGAQTSRPDDAGPVRNLRGGMASQGTLLTSLNSRRV